MAGRAEPTKGKGTAGVMMRGVVGGVGGLVDGASSHLSGVERYFCFWNFFSSPMSCSSVKMVRLRRGFLGRRAPCSASDSLLMLTGVSLGAGLGPRGGWGDSTGREGGSRLGGEDWARPGGWRVMTDRRGYARSEEGPRETNILCLTTRLTLFSMVQYF